MPQRYSVFLSYSRRDQEWVEVLHRNLETCLQAAGGEGWVFHDLKDIGSGSWVGQIQNALAEAGQLLLVVSPEALASSHVTEEWQGFHASFPDRPLHLARLVKAPLPPLLARLQQVDFREASEEKYLRGLQVLVAGLLGKVGRSDLLLPSGLTIPPPFEPRLPPVWRSRLIEEIEPVLKRRLARRAIAPRLGFSAEKLEDQPGLCAASAAIVWATADEVPVTAAVRIVDTFVEALEEEEPERVARLEVLRQELLASPKKGSDPGLLDLWLRQVASEHERLVPYFERQGEMDLLERVYVQLELRSEALRGTAVDLGTSRLGQSFELREALALDRVENPWVTGRWVLLGDPGAGKTTLLRHLAASLAKQEDRPWIPLYESLPRLAREGRSLLDRAVRHLELAGHPAQGLKAALEREAEQGRLLVLLDGLDEVPQDLREDAERLLRDLADVWPKTPLVVTSRPIGYRSPGSGFRELHLLPLDRKRRLDLLSKWLGTRSGVPDAAAGRRALATLDAPELRDLAGNPLYLTLIALLLKRGMTPERNRTRLYDQVFELLFDAKHRPVPAEPLEHQQALHELLGRLALGMTEDNRDAEPVSALEARLYRPELDLLRDTLERVPRWHGKMRQLLTDVAGRTGILGPHDGEDADWRFWHRTFREALAAERLAAEYSAPGGATAVLGRARAITVDEDLGRWAEPFALLVGRVDDPDELVRILIKENRPLGLRAVASAQNLRETTLREVLALTEDQEEREKVYSRLPELVGEPGRALKLLDQLRRKTRDGHDLFFLDLAVQEVGRRSPEHAREAEALRERFYDHIPKPPEELFRWIDTPLDGRVALWRKIPAGRFWMGSPEKEAGVSDEHPRHPVAISRAFLCGAVTVTQVQYAAFDDKKPFLQPAELSYHPVVAVTWYEAVSFCRWFSSVFSWARGARLPAEAEWEYFCRAGTETRYWSGPEEKDLARVGWYRANSEGRTHRVGEKPANPWGLYDVHGNAWEWTLDPWSESYEGREKVTHDPAALDTAAVDAAAREAPGGGGRVIRGGGYWDDAGGARAAFRFDGDPGSGGGVRGFRVVLTAGPELFRP
jgi:formylglycine-generating enzyme required for sulfatase activity